MTDRAHTRQAIDLPARDRGALGRVPDAFGPGTPHGHGTPSTFPRVIAAPVVSSAPSAPASHGRGTAVRRPGHETAGLHPSSTKPRDLTGSRVPAVHRRRAAVRVLPARPRRRIGGPSQEGGRSFAGSLLMSPPPVRARLHPVPPAPLAKEL